MTSSTAESETPPNDDGDCGENADDDEAEGDGRGALREEVGRSRHGAGAFEFQPAGGELRGEADADAEERCADQAEAGVAAEHVLGDVHVACVGVAVCDAEEHVEHDGKADGGEREGFGAQQFEELVFCFLAEDAKGVGGAGCGWDGMSDRRGCHGFLLI